MGDRKTVASGAHRECLAGVGKLLAMSGGRLREEGQAPRSVRPWERTT